MSMRIGYGFDSVASIIGTIDSIERKIEGLGREASLARRRKLIQKVDEKAIIATPANSSTNELVVEAARLSILNGGKWVKITYGQEARVELRD